MTVAGATRVARRSKRRRIYWSPVGLGALGFLVLVTVVAILAPIVAIHDPLRTSAMVLREPSSNHLMGTDYLGRDILSRIIWSTRLSLLVAVVSALIGALLGLAIGTMAGYLRGGTDAILMRVTDGCLVLPTFFVVVIVAALFGSSVWVLSVVIGLTNWPTVARLVRAEVLSLRTLDFVVAAEALGASTMSVLLRHIIPGTLALLLVHTSLRAGYAVVTEATLGFLGLGDPSGLSLGGMLTNTVQFARLAWWVAVFPGLAITALVVAFSSLGDTLADGFAVGRASR
jgi:peptide/nickel transport system permease protein